MVAVHLREAQRTVFQVFSMFRLGLGEEFCKGKQVSLFRPGNPMLELLTRPGRNYSISARFQW